MRLTMGAATHVGRVRAVNEDNYLATGQVAAVADGMGGHACGDVASRITIETLLPAAEATIVRADDIQDAVAAANEAILAASALDTSKSGMGTTITGLALVEHFGNLHWLAFNVGDSRVYRVLPEGLEQITHDHSEVAELVDAGRITAEEAKTHPLRNVVTRSLGTNPMPEMDTWLFPPRTGDAFVVCSDGLTNEVEDDEIARIVRDAATPADAAAMLVGAALDSGARDNVTTVVVRIDDGTVEDDTLVSTMPRAIRLEDMP